MVTHLPDSLPFLRADVRRLKQILINLLSNAIKFTHDDGLVMLRAGLTDNGDLKIDISDTGIGMDDDGIRTALRKFGQVDGSMIRDQEGSGLGLALTEGLITGYDGSMAIKSAPGEGTTVTIVLPKERLINLKEAV
jgi:signal transduction histidine kinase